jgi:hypothetical protein
VIPTLFEEAMRSAHSQRWLEAMRHEIRSIRTNQVWDLEEISKGVKTVGCKWVYKIKRDSKGNVKERKGDSLRRLHQREGINYNETFLLSHARIP